MPTVRSELIFPSRAANPSVGSSVSSPASATTSRSSPSCEPARAAVIAMRTAALSLVALVHGWSGTAKIREIGALAFRWRSITRR